MDVHLIKLPANGEPVFFPRDLEEINRKKCAVIKFIRRLGLRDLLCGAGNVMNPEEDKRWEVE